MYHKNRRDLRMKKYIVIIIQLVLTHTIIFSNDIRLHSIVEQTMTKEKREAINLWKEYLYSNDTSARSKLWNSEETQRFGDDYALFEQSLFQYGRKATLSFLTPFILNLEQQDSTMFITTMFSQFPLSISDSSIKNQNPASILKVAVSKENGNYKLANILSFETKFWNTYEVGKIKYTVHPSVLRNNEMMDSSNNYLDLLSNIWYGHEFDDTVHYYVASTSQMINSIVGFTFAYLGGIGSGQAFVKGKLIFSGNGNFFYKHELAHIVLGEFKNMMLSEGLATYFGGSNNVEYQELKRKFLAENKINTIDDIQRYLAYPNSMEYYMIGAILVENVYTINDINGLKRISNTEGSDDSTATANLLIKSIISELGISEGELIGFFK